MVGTPAHPRSNISTSNMSKGIKNLYHQMLELVSKKGPTREKMKEIIIFPTFFKPAPFPGKTRTGSYNYNKVLVGRKFVRYNINEEGTLQMLMQFAIILTCNEWLSASRRERERAREPTSRQKPAENCSASPSYSIRLLFLFQLYQI